MSSYDNTEIKEKGLSILDNIKEKEDKMIKEQQQEDESVAAYERLCGVRPSLIMSRSECVSVLIRFIGSIIFAYVSFKFCLSESVNAKELINEGASGLVLYFSFVTLLATFCISFLLSLSFFHFSTCLTIKERNKINKEKTDKTYEQKLEFTSFKDCLKISSYYGFFATLLVGLFSWGVLNGSITILYIFMDYAALAIIVMALIKTLLLRKNLATQEKADKVRKDFTEFVHKSKESKKQISADFMIFVKSELSLLDVETLETLHPKIIKELKEMGSVIGTEVRSVMRLKSKKPFKKYKKKVEKKSILNYN